MDKQVCEGCTYLDDDILHRCRANPNSCKDGKDCPDFIGEGNCACPACEGWECPFNAEEKALDICDCGIDGGC